MRVSHQCKKYDMGDLFHIILYLLYYSIYYSQQQSIVVSIMFEVNNKLIAFWKIHSVRSVSWQLIVTHMTNKMVCLESNMIHIKSISHKIKQDTKSRHTHTNTRTNKQTGLEQMYLSKYHVYKYYTEVIQDDSHKIYTYCGTQVTKISINIYYKQDKSQKTTPIVSTDTLLYMYAKY